ncbi:hypothetical protein ACQP2F_46455 (plasmid) [Actinoplanes sp. CA-030573]|uniref:hypothetical protein n=1 Tax=Actinoplanes sp. CA-030573 TaxID=3239898 RepID=UPI003D8E4FAB
MRDPRPGEEMYLVPNRPAAPSAAYAQPKVTIVHYMGARAVVRLPDGREIETDSRNLADERHGDRDRPKNIKIRPKLPDGCEEIALW